MKIEKITNSHIIQSINKSFPILFLVLNLASICLLINNFSSSLLASKICLLIITLLPCFIAVVLSFYLTNRIEYCLFAFIILIITKQNNIISAYLIAIVLYYLNYIFEKYLLNPVEVLSYKSYELSEFEYQKIIHGQSLVTKSDFEDEEYICLTFDNDLCAIAQYDENSKKLVTKKVFIS